MSIPRSIGWAAFRKPYPAQQQLGYTTGPLISRHIYKSLNAAIAAHFVDGSWEYHNKGLSPAQTLEARRTKVLDRYTFKEIFVND